MGDTGGNYGTINKGDSIMNKNNHHEEDVEQSEQLLEQLGYKQARGLTHTNIPHLYIPSRSSKIGLILFFFFGPIFFIRNYNENYPYFQHLVCESNSTSLIHTHAHIYIYVFRKR